MNIQIPNTFRQKILAKQTLIGFWMSMSSHITAEVAGLIGFDWLLLDGEHSPNEVPMFVHQLQALNASNSAAVGRPPANDPVIIKRFLDIGFYNLLIPFIESKEEAELAVSATRYPPQGIRGVSGSTRANGFGATKEFFTAVNDNITLLLQIETQKGVDAIDQIASVPGVDGIFIGPSDLAAALGYIGNPNHPKVQEVIKHLYGRSTAAGKAVGILAPGKDDAQRYIDMGMSFVAVGVDLVLFKQSMTTLHQHFQNVQ